MILDMQQMVSTGDLVAGGGPDWVFPALIPHSAPGQVADNENLQGTTGGTVVALTGTILHPPPQAG